MSRIDKIVKKYKLKSKTTEQLEKIVGDSDRGCVNLSDYHFLRGETYVNKVKNLQKYLNKHE